MRFSALPKDIQETVKDALSDCTQGKESGQWDYFTVPVVNDTGEDYYEYYSSGMGEPKAPYYYIDFTVDNELDAVIESIELILI